MFRTKSVTEPSEHAEKKAADPVDLRRLTAAIVAAHVAHNVVPPGDVARFITITHAALRAVTQPPADAATAKPVPAVLIQSSVCPDHVVCLEDGATLKTLKRHLAEAHGLTPNEYRRKWGLPSTYPMVAPDYAKQRSALAKASGLGTRAKAAVPATPPRRSRQTAKRAAPRRSR